jgi:hypothetical protein
VGSASACTGGGLGSTSATRGSYASQERASKVDFGWPKCVLLRAKRGRPARLVLPGRFRRAWPQGAGRAATEGRRACLRQGGTTNESTILLDLDRPCRSSEGQHSRRHLSGRFFFTHPPLPWLVWRQMEFCVKEGGLRERSFRSLGAWCLLSTRRACSFLSTSAATRLAGSLRWGLLPAEWFD